MGKQFIRPSQIITTFGPGSIVDLPDDSVMIAGIDYWFDNNKPFKIITEPRLQTALNVSEFRTPPVGSFRDNDVPFVRFPRWRVCPGCFMLSDRFRWPRGNPDLPPVPRCDRCNRETYPARIVVACPRGHIADFPWYRWVHRGQTCGGGNLFLRGEGRSASLGDLRAECSCGKSHTLTGALGADAMAAASCACPGTRPWLDDNREECTERLYAMQRGASNIYFSVTRSALSVPPWSDRLQAEVASLRSQFPSEPSDELWTHIIKERFPNRDPDLVWRCIVRLKDLRDTRPSIRGEEFGALSADRDHFSGTFETRRQEISANAATYLSRVVAVSRLREVRALVGFTRIEAPEMDPTIESFVKTAPISSRMLDWLPAVENLGEGIFVRVNSERLGKWEELPSVKERAGKVLETYSAWRQERGLQALKDARPRLILIHTLAHILMRQMSLECGYSSASLRERIYASEDMAGLLIYTSSPDSDGSLGGLIRQTNPPERFDGSLMSSVELAETCSSDPLCREHLSFYADRANGSACHACTMVSETSCEFGNRLLDRGTLVSFPNMGMTGYFDFDSAVRSRA
jgi:Domain of unknown function (DUF1998)